MEEVVDMKESSWKAPNSVTNCWTAGTPGFFRIPPPLKLVDLDFRSGRGRIGRDGSVFVKDRSSESVVVGWGSGIC